jgi:tetratricopeptide (TPR) repeat protein
LGRCQLFALCMGLAGVAALTFLPTSATIIWDIRWFPLYFALLFLMCLAVLPSGVRKKSSVAARIPLIGLSLLAGGLCLGAVTGPLPGRSLVYAFPALAAVVVGVFLFETVRLSQIQTWVSSRLFQTLIPFFLIAWTGRSLYLYVTKTITPMREQARFLDEAAGGGIFSVLWEQALQSTRFRNQHPFGHQNYVSGFLLLLLPLLIYGIRKPAGKGIRTLSLFALGLGVVILTSTQSRNALLGMAVGVGVLVWWISGNRKLLWQVSAAFLLLGVGLVWTLPRFQGSIFQGESARLGMWKAAWLTGVHSFPFGVGEGLTPEFLQLYSPQLSSAWTGSIQFHQTWLHLWAVSGLLGLAGIGLLTIWIGVRLLQVWKWDAERRKWVVPSAMALSASFVVFLADYQLDIFPIAILWVGHLVVLTTLCIEANPVMEKSGVWNWIRWVPVLALGIAAVQIPNSVRSRNQIDLAGAAFEEHDVDKAEIHFLKAFEYLEEPYSLNMAGRVVSENPARRRDAIALFDRSLELWEAQSLAHDYLTALWTAEFEERRSQNQNGVDEALANAFHHARRRAEISPELKGVYLDLAQLGHLHGAPREQVMDWIWEDLLMNGRLLFDLMWESTGTLAEFQDGVIHRLAEEDRELTIRQKRRRDYLRGWYVQIHPEATAIWTPDQAERWTERMHTRPEWMLLEAFCEAGAERKPETLLRLLVYVLRTTISPEAVNFFKEYADGEEGDCRSGLLNAGRVSLKRTIWNNVGISSRHPYSIPVYRPQRQPVVFGAEWISEPSQRFRAPVDIILKP